MMRMKVEIKRHGGCSMLYAWTEDPAAEPYVKGKFYGLSSRAICFVHNPDDEGIDLVSQTECENFQPGYTVFLTSDVTYKTFCSQLADSEFSKPERYHFLWHNCARGVSYALKLAGIHAIPSFSVINQVNGYVTDSLPLCALTPFDVLYYLKRYQYHLNRTTDVPRQLKQARAEFSLWANKSAIEKVVTLTHGINSQLIKLEDKYPELAPLFLEMYRDLTNHLTTQDSEQRVERIKKRFAIFAADKSQGYHHAQGGDFALTLLNTSILFSMLKCLLYYAFDASHATHSYINNIGISIMIVMLGYAAMKHNEATNNTPSPELENAKSLNDSVNDLLAVMKK